MVVRTLLEVLDVAARERDADFVDLRGGHGCTSRVVFLFTLSDVTHPGGLEGDVDSGDCVRTSILASRTTIDFAEAYYAPKGLLCTGQKK